jgi:hypothetical protein
MNNGAGESDGSVLTVTLLSGKRRPTVANETYSTTLVLTAPELVKSKYSQPKLSLCTIWGQRYLRGK